MKKFIFNILLFFAIVAVVDLFVGFVGGYLQSHAKGGSTKEFNNLVQVDCHDILVLGSSRAHHHYDTPFLSDTLGLDVYNAGYNGNGVVLAYGILDMVLMNYSPKLVIFDVEPSFDILVYEADDNHKRYLADLKPYYNKAEIGGVIQDVSTEEWYKVHSGMMRYNTTIIKKLIDRIISRGTPYKGYLPLQGIIDRKKKNDNEGKEAYNIDDFKLNYIEHLIDLAQSTNIPILFVASPQILRTNSSVMNPVIEICNNKGVPFLNYYTDSLFTSHIEWFNDPLHLNSQGARKFSEIMVTEINKAINTKTKDYNNGENRP